MSVHPNRLQWLGFWIREGRTWRYQGTGIEKREMGNPEFFTRLHHGQRHRYTASHYQTNGIPKAIPVSAGDVSRWNMPIGELVMAEETAADRPKLRVVNSGR